MRDGYNVYFTMLDGEEDCEQLGNWEELEQSFRDAAQDASSNEPAFDNTAPTKQPQLADFNLL
jgi:hypothetical protein